MKRVLLIGDSHIDYAPYIKNYTDLLEQSNIPFHLLFWNRYSDYVDLPDNYISYNQFTEDRYPLWKKGVKVLGFARFVKKHLKRNDYAYVVVFTIVHALFLYPYLNRHYSGRFIYDIRDYSPICRIGFLKIIMGRLITHSAFTVTSSAGFLKWLPSNKECRYIVSHNINYALLGKYIDAHSAISFNNTKETMKVLTIGKIAYYGSQVTFLNKMGNRDGVELHFAGEGPAAEPLKQYVVDNAIKNVGFSGRYAKCDELSIVEPYHMLNIWLDHSINADTCVANRFYLSAILRKPMIVHRNTYQGYLCSLYGLGVVLDENDDFYNKIIQWWNEFDYQRYDSGCKRFLSDVQTEMKLFNTEVTRLYYQIEQKC